MYRVWDFVTTYSLLMIAGAVAALLWANIGPASYEALVGWTIWEDAPIGHPHYAPDGAVDSRRLTLQVLVKDVLMAFFFFVAGKEVWEAVALREGSLRGRRALVPLAAAVGGMAVPVAIYLGLLALILPGSWEALARGWAVPTATDIALSFIVARAIFGAGHPAVRFLLLLAIVDDALGLLILAVAYPQGALQPQWLLLSGGAALGAFALFNWLPRRLDRGDELRRHAGWVRRRLALWPYAAAGALSWYGFQQAGIHPALGLLPVIPAIPHADRDFGVYAEAEDAMPDLLNRAEHLLKLPVEFILLLFGLTGAGVALGAVGAPTLLVLAGLLLGKPLGVLLLGWAAARSLGLPEGMGTRDVLVVGAIASMGFTVALFVAGVAFPEGATQDAAKLGALLSVAGAAVAWALARALGVGRAARARPAT
jgi:NhaA family Na+:H+ antiporter